MIYPGQNAYGIPDLMPSRCSGSPGIPEPLRIWRSVAKQSGLGGMWAFYTDDRRFDPALWNDADSVPRTGCVAAIEPNFSLLAGQPFAVAVWQTYRKRWLARHWQAAGVDVWVDLYVGTGHELVNLTGVPYGWQRWATCGSTVDDPHGLDRDAELVLTHAAGEPATLLVYGGGREAREWCLRSGSPGLLAVHHVPHRSDGRYRPGEGTRRARLTAG